MHVYFGWDKPYELHLSLFIHQYPGMPVLKEILLKSPCPFNSKEPFLL